jgi:TolB-like protein/DNA-binding winged helix-turn-helix (wHTH) protein
VTANDSFILGDWTVDPDLGRISREGRQINLQPQVMDLLVYLATHHKEVVSTDELLANIWEDRIVTSSSIYSCLKQLREALGDDAQNPSYIKTIPKRGYCLIAKVEFPESHSEVTTASTAVDRAFWGNPFKSSRKSFVLAAVAGLAIIMAVVLLYEFRTPKHPEEKTDYVPEKSIAVLPFTDMTPELDHGWFSDGMSEEILNKLAQLPGLKVTGRTSSFLFRQPEEDLQSIGAKLGVAHLLEGSVRKDGERVRVTAQLIRAKDGFHIWSQVYDRDITDTIAIQDDISGSIANALKLQISDDKSQQPNVLTAAIHPEYSAYELYLQSRALMDQNTKLTLMSALSKLEKALRIDPRFANAHVAMARTYQKLTRFSGYYSGNSWPGEMKNLAQPHLDLALAIDPNNGNAYVVQGDIYVGEKQQALQAYKKALSLNPNLYKAHMSLGVLQLEELVSWNDIMPHLDRAIEIEPLSVEAAQLWVMFLSFIPHRWSEAETVIANLKQRSPELTDVKLIEAMWLLADRGQLSEAIPILEDILVLDPDNAWAKDLLTKAWYMLGETERAMKMPGGRIFWRYVLAPDREASLQQLRAEPEWDPNIDFGRRVLAAYAYVMLRDWQSAIDLLEPDSLDLDEFTDIHAQNLGQNVSPAMSLAVAYKGLGDQAMYEKFANFEKNAVNIRTDNGKLHNFEYSRAMARLNAMEGNGYEALLELNRLISKGPNDPRELLHPAFDAIHDDPGFVKLVQLQRQRVNEERGKLGLAALPDR